MLEIDIKCLLSIFNLTLQHQKTRPCSYLWLKLPMFSMYVGRHLVVPAAVLHEENETHSIGMFLFDTLHQTRIVMDGLVAKELIEAWRCCVGKQLIGQVELLPVVITKLLYRDLFKGRRCVYFIDNDSARECLIRVIPFLLLVFPLFRCFS